MYRVIEDENDISGHKVLELIIPFWGPTHFFTPAKYSGTTHALGPERSPSIQRVSSFKSAKRSLNKAHMSPDSHSEIVPSLDLGITTE
ncbi:hypothetical protein E2C01_030654 [Portunus trituberculatus]|uniref:Uncharacterized protein n=1 Tax=Portunus trituberculatus TaxID=210409 RepID=A0A5B7ER00_PORTR|nr:hypothetical protein [Portunus trituberculatus]